MRRLLALTSAIMISQVGCGDASEPADIFGEFTPFEVPDIAEDISFPHEVVECLPDCWTSDCGADPACGMVLIPAGTFRMGCDPAIHDDCRADQLPLHEVNLDAYYMDRTEVTVDAYRACVDAGMCTAPVDPVSNCEWFHQGHLDHPMNCVDWFQAQQYCQWLGRRLPTEAEWEKAARGTDGRTYPWGEAAVSCEYAATFDEESGGRGCGTDDTLPVCSKSPLGDSPYGLCDMAGNVWELVGDWYGELYYSESPALNPMGPSTGPGRVARGGTITLVGNREFLRTFFRNYHQPTAVDILMGFRCARDAD